MDEKQIKEYARLFASKGGKARKEKLTAEELSKQAKKANAARIKKYGFKRKKKKGNLTKDK